MSIFYFPASILTFLDTPFIEYPQGSNKKSSIIMFGISLSIPDFWVASSAEEHTSLVKRDITSGSKWVIRISKVWSGSMGSSTDFSLFKVYKYQQSESTEPKQ